MQVECVNRVRKALPQYADLFVLPFLNCIMDLFTPFGITGLVNSIHHRLTTLKTETNTHTQ